jgi:exonuclease III
VQCEDTVKAGSLKSLLHQIQQYQRKVTAIQETRWLGKGIFDTRSHTVLYSGKEKCAHEAGVAFIVDKTITRNILKFDSISERDCVLHLKTRFFNLSIINAYAPQKTRRS